MKKYTLERSVGVFVLIGLICVGYLTIKLGKMELIGGNHYYLVAKFASVSGLKDGAIVDVAGVEIGKVDRIDLDREEMVAVVRMKIRKGVPIDRDVIASIKTSGLIGDKYVKLTPGGSEEILENGDRIIETESAIDLESVIGKYAFGEV